MFVDADAARLSAVLSNLLVNASKFSPRGSSITLSCHVTQDVLEVRVRDRGEGISRDMLQSGFEPFVQSQQGRDRSRGGLGLGLAIARNIVATHGGSIHAYSEGAGRSAELTVRLPLASPPKARSDLPASQQPGAARRVLLVDDNIDGADALAAVLEAHGHQLATAYDPVEALRIAREFPADMAVLDLGLPGMDGYELARRLQEATAGAPPRFVALTGYGVPNDHQRSNAAGFSAHLVKPVDADQLLKLLDRGP